MGTTFPVAREEVGLARTVDGQFQEVFTELTSVPDLETTPGSGDNVSEERSEATKRVHGLKIRDYIIMATEAYM